MIQLLFRCSVATCSPEYVQLLVLDKTPLFFSMRDGPWFPTLRLLHQVRAGARRPSRCSSSRTGDSSSRTGGSSSRTGDSSSRTGGSSSRTGIIRVPMFSPLFLPAAPSCPPACLAVHPAPA